MGNAVAGGIKSVANTSSSITFNNAGYATNGSFIGATVIHIFDPCGAWFSSCPGSSKVLPMTLQSSATLNQTMYTTTKTFKMKVCGGTYNGQWNQFIAVSSTKYTHVSPKSGTKNVSFSSKKRFVFAGAAASTTSGTANSNLVRTFDYTTNAGCSARRPTRTDTIREEHQQFHIE